ncbi:MAG: DUF481 domain-containing protein [Gemmatimonadota bacterium]|nr:DUF481 domain-containing protein [Gemmatimonadota bacterium]
MALTSPLRAQSGPEAGETINLFYDCQGFGCWDDEFLRREIPWVNWVRDRQDADVHVMVTTQTTGGGGRQYALVFMGREEFEGQDQELKVNTAGDATDDEVRQAIAARLKLGLGRYVAETPLADRIQMSIPAGPEGTGGGGPRGPPAAGGQDDPWDYWVFRVGGNGYLSGESAQTGKYLSAFFTAGRTTDELKFALQSTYDRNTWDVEYGGTTTSTLIERADVGALLVMSLNDRWSLGGGGEWGKSTYENIEHQFTLSGGVEMNVFPYAESSRRSLTFQGIVEARQFRYLEETVYLETEETRVVGSLTSSLNFVQPWGQSAITLDHSRYFHDLSKYQTTLRGSVEMRVFKGFSVNVGGMYQKVRDQLSLPRMGATLEEVLTRQRELETDHRYRMFFGVSYRFGSIFNNVVNPRWGGIGGGGMIMMF